MTAIPPNASLHRLPAWKEVREAIERAQRAIPELTVSGIGAGESVMIPRLATDEQLDARFKEERAALLSPNFYEPFILSRALVSSIPKTRAINPGAGSYRLKNIAEKFVCHYPDRTELRAPYVANGILIAAAVDAGFEFRYVHDCLGRLELNVVFNMSKRVLDDLDYEIRGYPRSRRHWK